MAGSIGGAFTGLYQGSTGASDAANALRPLLPGISVYNSNPSSGPVLQNQVTTPSTSGAPTGGALQQFEHFLGGLGSEVGHLATGAADWVGKMAVNMATAPIRFGTAIGHGFTDNLELNSINSQSQQINGRIQTLHNQYKSGQISTKQYTLGLKEISGDAQGLSKMSGAVANRASFDQKASVQSGIDTASALVTIMTAGLGAAPSVSIKMGEGGVSLLADSSTQTAAQWMMGKVAEPLLVPTSNFISKVAGDSRLFQALDSATQSALQHTTGEVIANAGEKMTAGQIAQATVSNLALKYPLQYWYLSGTGTQVYNELDNQKYGDAVRTLAFNAALTLTGGPIGHALSGLKIAGKAISERVFGQTSFWDELSHFYGNQETDGYSRAISDALGKIEDPQAQKEFIKNLAAVEATNVHAVGGDVAGAAARVAKGMQSAYSFDLSSVTHTQGLDDMVNWAKNARIVSETARKLGLGNLAVGRVDARDLNSIATYLGDSKDSGDAISRWQSLKQQMPNQAWANNDNFDRQITDLIQKHSDNLDGLPASIRDIKAQFAVPGFPEDIAKSMAKDGYFPIKPKNLEAPFTEGESRIVTSTVSGANSDFFVKAVQPLPILGSVGTLLTHLGLSPNNATERTYEYFTDAMSRRLEESGYGLQLQQEQLAKQAEVAAKAAQKATPKVQESLTGGFSKDELDFMKKQGITPETHPEMFTKGNVHGEVQAGAGVGAGTTELSQEAAAPISEASVQSSDDIIKKLSNYANERKLPVSDMRMLTTKDIQEALNTSARNAKEIQDAIVQAHLDVPLALRGMGDRAVDWTYKGAPGAVARRYYRIQGALRFSFNPFFQYLRVIPKTEILSESHGGGYLSSIFAGRAGQINQIRDGLRVEGFLHEVGQGGFLGNTDAGEATEATGLSKNLNKKLLPMQERSIAGMIDAQAQRMGMNWQDYIHAFPHETADTIQGVAQYSKRANYLNSPLARTLNIAIFPSRFDTKVVQAMANGLARTSTLTQAAVVSGMMKAHAWLNSPEGQAWYSQNSLAIGLFNYITPLASMAEVISSLMPGHDHSLGNFGELGGLPFGWIPQVLDAEGLTHFNQPGVDARTGQTIPKYIPTTLKGQAAVAIQDFLGSLFSYPGATAGLPSKTSITRNAALGIVGGSKTKDMQLITPSLSADQQHYQSTIQSANGTTPQTVQGPPIANQPSGNTFEPSTATAPDLAQALRDKEAAAAAKKASKLKKADIMPVPAPGQSALGVL